MNEVSQQKKESVTKTLAIVGFIAVIIFIVFLSVQVVRLVPGAFASLASIADSLYNYQGEEALTVSTKNSVVNAGESFTISWTDMRRDGVYRFTYECVDGVALDVRTGSGDINSIACDSPLELGENTTLDVVLSSEKQRFTDVPYTITFQIEGDQEKRLSANSVITVVNASIPTSARIAEEDDEGETTDESPRDEEGDAEGQVAGESTDETTTTPNTVNTPTYYTTYVQPVSDPNGYVDLSITHVGVGELSGNTFVPTATVDQDAHGAIRFEIKNIGTKTSGAWHYVAHLPSDITYTASPQLPLKPQEKAIITIGFDGVTQTGIQQFDVAVDADEDINGTNNSYVRTLEITD